MDIKHRIGMKDCELLIFANDDLTFHVSLCSTVNPLGRGNLLDRFDDERQAIEAAERFQWMYALAKEHGYYLKQDRFTKPNRQEIHISVMKDGTMTKEQYRLQLQA
ncbi:hypothetical protein [Paenibacillus koleovorans]|uniref:hypothetical protein n=1 Tax=Paenibacillus koleovorans TaxID=121608 RepID=UPI000FD73654|nr:hypothetical protein [Paenibacillus koleovorans]